MLLRKYMSLMGVGSAQIDLILEKDVLIPGESVNGKFLIKGGTVDQDLQMIECALVMVNLKTEEESVLDTVIIDVQLKIQPDGDDDVPFSFLLPEDVPPSNKDISYHFKTKLVFKQGIESWDEDLIKVVKG
ncbi:sporulation protein [Mesobacillus jeotgali]|jgi:sporulation-control protein|uniref:Sporulation protein n=1 Tax=Mesobacillus jeotgali TaxID=129985 RepID=A0ABY9VM10_9BACI|nr:sporulation protein [Mesobacillus jeotgali]WNF23766.1 sporulation protein [Mesobacillus jeotgali]